jgi:hypothetical protein
MAKTPSINTFHASNFELTISNVPTIKTESDLHMYHNFVRSISLPGYNMNVYDSTFMGENYVHPLNRMNDNLGDLSITFRLNEHMLNYFYMAQYLMDMRYAVNDSEAKDHRMKKNVIEAITITMLDNQHNRLANIEYNTCLPTAVSGLEVDYTNSNEVDFTVTFKFQEVHFRSA